MTTEGEIFVSDYNRIVLGNSKAPPRVKILDTTLRDGEQTPNVALAPADKLKIATALDDLGVDIIEAGFPANSAGEAEAVKAIAAAGLRAEVCALARAHRGDIDAALKCDTKAIHLFIATSDLHMKYKLRMDREEVKARATEAVEYAKAHGLTIEWSCEDATRTDLAFLREMHRLAEAAGAHRIDIPDTVGVMTPPAMAYLIGELSMVTNIPLAVHCHNDFGLAVANSLAAVGAGAQEVHCTVNGLGERAGNAALEEVVLGLRAFYDCTTGVDTRRLNHVSHLVSRLTGVVVQPNKAVVGANAFAHESGIHVHGVLGHGATYEPMAPDLVGVERRLLVGKHTGAHGVARKLADYGLELPKERLSEVVARVKGLAEGGKRVEDAELVALAYDALGRTPAAENPIRMEEFTAVTGLHFTPSATVALVGEGLGRRAALTGVGPVDAALKAIRVAVSDAIRLVEYKLEAITAGSDALCEVTVKLAQEESPLALGRAVGPDIVVTSINATLEALNRLWGIRGKPAVAKYSSSALQKDSPAADPHKAEGL
jgi:isopropylmalate/citramalate/homocitrate synthase-like protein